MKKSIILIIFNIQTTFITSCITNNLSILQWLRERIDKTAVGTDAWEFTAGCQCVGSCTDPSTCTCAQEMGKSMTFSFWTSMTADFDVDKSEILIIIFKQIVCRISVRANDRISDTELVSRICYL